MIDRAYIADTATRIEQACIRYGAPCKVEQIRVLPAFYDFALHPANGVRVAQVRSLRDDFALVLGDPSTVIRQNGHLSLQVRRDPPQVVKGDTLMQQMPDLPHVALLGIAEDGSILTVNIASPETCHTLICGCTGSGKTILARTFIASLVLRNRPHEVGVIVVDPKRSSDTFARSIGSHLLAPVAHEVDEAVSILARCIRVMEQRTRPTPRIVIYVDETADLCLDERVLTMLQRIAQRGRESGLHLLCVTQKPLASAIGPLLKGNLPLRIIGRVLSASESSTASGIAGLGAQYLGGRGDFIIADKGIRFAGALPPTLPPTTTATAPAMELPAAALPDAPDVTPTTPTTPGDDLVSRIADFVREFPNASLNEISRQVTGRPYAGTSHCARLKAAVELARSTTTTAEKAPVETVSGATGSSSSSSSDARITGARC